MKPTQLRVIYTETVLSPPITGASDSYEFFLRIWDKSLINIQEQVYVLFLNNCNEVICWRCLNTGSCSETLFDLKFALSCALNCLASKIIIAHNHPSGFLKPSFNDIAITKKLSDAAQLLDITLADHLILNKRSYYSFTNNLLLKKA